MRPIVKAYGDISLAAFNTKHALESHQGNIKLQESSPLGLTEIGGVPVYVAIDGAKSGVIVGAVGWGPRAKAVERLSWLLTDLWLPLVLIVVSITWFASRTTFEPLERMAKQAEELSTENLASRLDVEYGEYAEFAERLNRFLDRLELSVRHEEQFVSDAAHELRTPLTALRGRIETSLMRARTVAEYQQLLHDVLLEAERLSGLVEMLLQSASIVSGEVPILDVQAELERAHARWVDRFANLSVEVELASQPAAIRMKPREFEVILDNLLSNALKAVPKGGHCAISSEVVDGDV